MPDQHPIYFFIVGHGRAIYISRSNGYEGDLRFGDPALPGKGDFCTGKILSRQRAEQFFGL